MSDDRLPNLKKSCKSKGCLLLLCGFGFEFIGGFIIGLTAVIAPPDVQALAFLLSSPLLGIGSLLFIGGAILLIVGWVVPGTGEQSMKKDFKELLYLFFIIVLIIVSIGLAISTVMLFFLMPAPHI